MNKTSITGIVICFFIMPVLHAQEQSSIYSERIETNNNFNIVVTSLDITDKALKLQYEIRNDSEQDIWIFSGEYLYDEGIAPGIETYIAEDGQTITLRSSLEPGIKDETEFLGPPAQFYGNYVRLRPGEHQTESISQQIPFYTKSATKQIWQKEQELKYATRLAIELAYYPGNQTEVILRRHKPYSWIVDEECTFSRNEQVLILESRNKEKEEERILRTVVDNLNIPYRLGKYEGYQQTKIKPPDLFSCVKIEFEYKPSILEHLFPYPTQQNLLSLQEKECLVSEKIVITDPNKIKIFAKDVRKCTDFGGVGKRYRSYIDVTCYYEDKPPSSFTIYNDNTISIDGVHLVYFNLSSGKLVVYPETLSSLKKIIPRKIQEIDSRMQCAANLEDLWYRLCFQHGRLTKLKEGPSIRTLDPYPDSKTWCDSLNNFKIPLICQSAGEGKCHYAMNPYCEPNSPSDMVLLFETKAGWNQHGGPELFTFDNQESKRPAPDVLPSRKRSNGGGCVNKTKKLKIKV